MTNVVGTNNVLLSAIEHGVKNVVVLSTDKAAYPINAMGISKALTVAVDPTRIPYGTRMFIVSDDGQYVYGIATAEDCGGGIKGDRIDLYYPTYEECMTFGRRSCTIYFLG